jgi:hypothetical protein
MLDSFSALGINNDNIAYSVLIVGFLVVMIITKASQAGKAPPCKRPSQSQPKPLLPIASPFIPLDFLIGKKQHVPEDKEFASIPLIRAQPEIFSMSTRSRRTPVKI